ncbi:MAG: T9SS type A sorting domain-containing protein, partial [Bacteroidota bacterium]|nr:T9SS type A sorting domain-containing protein [Bacteroidota bacterium]
PNPASDKVIIEVGSTSIGNLQIIGTLGQIVHQEKFLEAVIELDLTGFSPGIYFVRIQIAGRHFAQPLVIQ